MKTVGVIGGLGPETTAEFYLEVVFGCFEKNPKRRPAMLVWNVPLEYEVEKELLTKSTGEARYKPYLIDAARRLEGAGADFLVMPCNTLHVYINDIRKAVKIPVLSVVEETALFLRKRKAQSVGILATGTSLKHGLYEKALADAGIAQLAPDGLDQAKIGKALNNLVRSRHDNQDRELLLRVIDKLERKGGDCVLLACTDLQLLLPSHPKIPVFDTMKILADATVREVLS